MDGMTSQDMIAQVASTPPAAAPTLQVKKLEGRELGDRLLVFSRGTPGEVLRSGTSIRQQRAQF